MIQPIAPLLDLRLLVAALGEAHHDKWWRSRFLSHTGLSFLERIYPRSAFAAALRSATRAAQAVHDSSIGKGTVSHLFRPNPELERRLDGELDGRAQELEEQYRPLLMKRDVLLQKLQELSDGFEIDVLIGPVQVDVADDELVPALAAIYLMAFRHGKQVFPYLEEEVALT